MAAFFSVFSKLGQAAAKVEKPAEAAEKSATTVSHAESSAAGELMTSGKMLDAASVKKENLPHELSSGKDPKAGDPAGQEPKPASKWWDYANKAGIVGGVAGLGVTGWQLVTMGKNGSTAGAKASDVGAAGAPLTQAGSMSAYGSPVVAAPTMQGLSSGAGPAMQPNYAGQAAMGNAGMTPSEIASLTPFVAPPTETFSSHPMNLGMGGGISGIA